MSRIERNNTKTSNSENKIKSFWQNGKNGTRDQRDQILMVETETETRII